tara:strand:+ start:2205 stop:2390 length:186 start_codon:yes stop_codon:yes gene_type:complete
MSIPSINASYHSGSSDPRLDRTWVKREEYEKDMKEIKEQLAVTSAAILALSDILTDEKTVV